MGWNLYQEAVRYAPNTLTHREIHVLGILAAYYSDDDTRTCKPDVDANLDELCELCRTTERQYYAVVKALVSKGGLEQVHRGQKHRRAVYRIPEYVEPGRLALLQTSQGAQNPQAEPTVGGVIPPVSDDFSLRKNRTLSPDVETAGKPSWTQPPIVNALNGGKDGSTNGNPPGLGKPQPDPIDLALAEILNACAGNHRSKVGAGLKGLRKPVQQALDQGHTPKDIGDVVRAKSLDTANDPAGAIASRVFELSKMPPTKRKKRPDWCQECDQVTRRLVEPNTCADLGPCPKCNPKSQHFREAVAV